jgi:hypothetical protein
VEARSANIAARREGKPTLPKTKQVFSRLNYLINYFDYTERTFCWQNRAGFEGKSGSDFLNKKKSGESGAGQSKSSDGKGRSSGKVGSGKYSGKKADA